MNIEKVTTVAWYSPLTGRRYLSKTATIKATARALIKSRYPTEKQDDYYGGWHWKNLNRSDVLYRRVCRLVKNSIK